MVPLQALLALCLVGATVAAPQLRLGDQRSVSRQLSSLSSQDEVVSNVVSALGPSIAAAVQEALAAQAQTEAAAQRRRLQLQRQDQAQAQGQAAAAAAAATAASSSTEDPLAEDPKYNFEYKVSDENDQTYISQSEERDGDELSGTYSFVDPRGALITVNYAAGPMGYTENREEQLGFVQIRSKPARILPTPTAPKVDQASLIQRILAALQPQIGSAVSSALTARRNAAAAAQAEAARLAAAEQQRLAQLEQQRLAQLEQQRLAQLEQQRRAAAAAAAAEASRLQAIRFEAEQRAAAAAAARADAQRLARLEQERLAAEAAAAASAKTGSLSLFGDGGYSVRVQTPVFKIEY